MKPRYNSQYWRKNKQVSDSGEEEVSSRQSELSIIPEQGPLWKRPNQLLEATHTKPRQFLHIPEAGAPAVTLAPDHCMTMNPGGGKLLGVLLFCAVIHLQSMGSVFVRGQPLVVNNICITD